MRIWKYQQIIPLPLSNTLLNLSRSRFSPAHPQTWHHPVAFSFRKILVILLKPLIFPLLPLLSFLHSDPTSYNIVIHYLMHDVRKAVGVQPLWMGCKRTYIFSLFFSLTLSFSPLSLSLSLSLFHLFTHS